MIRRKEEFYWIIILKEKIESKMSQIIIFYKGKLANFNYVFGVCGILKKRDLIVDKEHIKDTHDNESGLRKIVYNLPNNKYLPSDLDLDDMSKEIVGKCSLNIKLIKGVEDSNRKYKMPVRNENG